MKMNQTEILSIFCQCSCPIELSLFVMEEGPENGPKDAGGTMGADTWDHHRGTQKQACLDPARSSVGLRDLDAPDNYCRFSSH